MSCVEDYKRRIQQNRVEFILLYKFYIGLSQGRRTYHNTNAVPVADRCKTTVSSLSFSLLISNTIIKVWYMSVSSVKATGQLIVEELPFSVAYFRTGQIFHLR